MEKPFATTSSGGEALLEPSWPELLGCNNWEGLLHPFNLSLRRLILQCGDFCEATYDAFENDVKSAYAGSSKYGKKNFFNKVMLDDSAAKYQVAYFLYATADGIVARRVLTRSLALYPWDNKSNFMGYIATTTDEVSRALGRREIYVVWRGTEAKSEWKAELLNFCMESADVLMGPTDDHHGCCCCCCCKAKVMAGFLKIYISKDPNNPFAKCSARQQVQTMIRRLIEMYKNENVSIIVTGHSLGASLSVLSAFDLVENVVRDIPVSAIVFACPKVGNRAFRKRVNSHPNLKILHIKNSHDWVPKIPFFFLGYVDTGISLTIDSNKSPYLKRSCSIIDWHNLNAMLHVIAGWNGRKGRFNLEVERSVALVNKYSDLLKDRWLVPAEWWVQEKRGMVRGGDGEWAHAPPSEEDKPVPEFIQ